MSWHRLVGGRCVWVVDGGQFWFNQSSYAAGVMSDEHVELWRSGGGTIAADKLWQRIGVNGMPPLARNVYRNGTLVGRIVDLTEYQDTPDPLRELPMFNVERYKRERFVDLGIRMATFEAAVVVLMGMVSDR